MCNNISGSACGFHPMTDDDLCAIHSHLNSLRRYTAVAAPTADSTGALATLVQRMEQMCANQQAALEQAQRANEMVLQQQRILTAVALRSELRAFNGMASQWKQLPLPNGDPFPAGVPFPRNIRDLKDNMSKEDVCRLAQIYEIEHVEGEKRLRDQLSVFIAGVRA
ncbi:hypothetical protein BN946_scf184998.g16 [Trametes cinnabarina]|uniref:Uncharacterized protein n=1 Tax=Pycnoporus cinnabarinus TaxID=5643 RepID=A0A060S8B7_PYCCI|nr:hypothetical protein BN946_scf184998.g16 [Trametes cinnabarina]